LIPEIVEEVWQNKERYSPKATRDFIQFAYKISRQEQKQIFQQYKGKLLRIHSDFHKDTHSDERGDIGPAGSYNMVDGENIHEDYHTDKPEVSIHFPRK
jgi:hypothetical protein